MRIARWFICATDMIMDEPAKATGEIAKTAGKFAEITEKVGGFVAKIIGPTCIQVGGIFEDWASFYRFNNLLKIGDKVEAIHSRRKLEGKTVPIPPKVAIPMLLSAALEDDETLQDVWAKLIANSTDPNFKTALHPGYIEIIKQMSPDEAIILDSLPNLQTYPMLFSHHVSQTFESTGNSPAARIRQELQGDEASYQKIHEMFIQHGKSLPLKEPADLQVYIDNLIRLRIVEMGHDFSSAKRDLESVVMGLRRRASSNTESPSVAIPARDEFLRMTIFGQRFVMACISERSTDAKSGFATDSPANQSHP